MSPVFDALGSPPLGPLKMHRRLALGTLCHFAACLGVMRHDRRGITKPIAHVLDGKLI